ncbi:hypothetical protein [Marinobacterium jannaschii]|uniref:hypothetical protein n=1 Tax=Marinobacterium jannaschii TaxID=64970 RepID=UPI000AF08BB7|nr:hypothetical protein [Marinobacterium jannaschii]
MTTAVAPNDALARWQQPHPDFASGHDMRSSENGLLNLFYGSLEHAARYQWLNAGRTLVDKTYLRILWSSCDMAPVATTYDQLASNLDSFIRDRISAHWEQLDELDHDQRHQLAIELVEQAAIAVFPGNPNWRAASMLLFFLCPQLPVFAWHHELQSPQSDSQEPAGYAGYHAYCRQRLAQKLPHSATPPAAVQGDERQCKLIDRLLSRGDWWQRRCLFSR